MILKKFDSKLVVKIIAVVIGLAGIYNLFSALTPAVSLRLGILRDFIPIDILYAGRTATVIIGYVLVVLSQKLVARNKNAFVVTLVILSVNSFAHIIKGLDYEEALISLLLVLVLLIFRSYFTAKADKGSLLNSLKVLSFSLTFTLVYYLIGRLFISERFSHLRFILWFKESVFLLGLTTFLYAVSSFFTEDVFGSFFEETDLERAKRIIKKYSKNSMSLMLTQTGKRYFFPKLKDNLIVFKNIKGYSVALAGPIGTRPKVTLKRFSELCALNAKKSVFWNVRKEDLKYFSKKEFKFIHVGSEAIIDLKDYSFDGQDKKPLRYSISRMSKDGFKFEVVEKVGDKLVEKLKKVSDKWLTTVFGNEKEFTTGKFEEDYVKRSLVALLIDTKQNIAAFVSFYVYDKNKLAIDLMRSVDNLPPDAMLSLISNLIIWAKDKDYVSLSLGLAPLHKLKNKLYDFIFERFNVVYNFKGLWIFKSKFKPQWQERYMVYSKNDTPFSSALAVYRSDFSLSVWRDLKYAWDKNIRRKTV